MRSSAYKLCSFKGYSRISQKLFDTISSYFKGHEIYYGDNEYAVKTAGENYHVYHVDYYDRDLNVVIEFYGDYWHFNPCKYKATDKVNLFGSKSYITVKEKWDKDAERINDILTTLGCLIFIIWETSYYNNDIEIIDNIVNMLNRTEDTEKIIIY